MQRHENASENHKKQLEYLRETTAVAVLVLIYLLRLVTSMYS